MCAFCKNRGTKPFTTLRVLVSQNRAFLWDSFLKYFIYLNGKWAKIIQAPSCRFQLLFKSWNFVAQLHFFSTWMSKSWEAVFCRGFLNFFFVFRDTYLQLRFVRNTILIPYFSRSTAWSVRFVDMILQDHSAKNMIYRRSLNSKDSNSVVSLYWMVNFLVQKINFKVKLVWFLALKLV